MKNFNTKPFVRFLAVAAPAACLFSTPVSAAEVQPRVYESKMANIQSAAAQGYVSGLDTINKNEKESAAAAVKKTGFAEIDGKTYYFNQFGQKVTGPVTTEEGSYYFSDNGEMMTGFVTEDDKTWYFDETDGKRAQGTVEANGATYILSEDGEIQNGWVEENGQKFYLDETGAVIKNQTKSIDGTQYSFDENGAMETNVSKNGFTYNEKGEGTPDLSGYDKIAEAALAQLGVNQDCTMLVTNSLKAVGINHHGAPASYLSLGPLTDNPVPGDIIVYSGHVAIYIGDGKAVHGGWNGYTTAIFSVECSQPLVGYVHPILP